MQFGMQIKGNIGGCGGGIHLGGHGGHHHHGCHGGEQTPDAPQRNGFLDLLTAPGQALGLKGGNQNDRNYDHYMHAVEAGNAMKGCC